MTRRRQLDPLRWPEVPLACGCVVNRKPCPVAERLWDRVAVANKNLTRSLKFPAPKPPTTYRAHARVEIRRAIYSYRHAVYSAHFGGVR